MEVAIKWEEFKKQASLLMIDARDDGAKILFRGHASSNWSLQTTLDRSSHSSSLLGYYNLALRVKSEVEAFTALRWDSAPDLGEVTQLFSNYESFSRAMTFGNLPHYPYLAYLRHHGFPSPLLDWSTSPYVAAFFAFRDNDADAENAAIFAYRERDASGMKIGGGHEPAITVLGPYVAGPRRHFLQRSQYTVCNIWESERNQAYFYDHSAVCRPFDPNKKFQQDIIYKFVLPRTERDKILAELQDYNLNAYTLFGSEEGLMEALSVREELNSR
ncbi:FRG domain-containing protein [Bradyrhizobium sp. 18BD]